MSDETRREGERVFSLPDAAPFDAGLRFIGRIVSPWTERSACPKNMRQARERGQAARVELFPPYQEALAGLEAGSPIFLFTFLDRARRDLALQMPRHADSARGTFSLRSPVRPNPIGLHLVELVAVDRENGLLSIDAIDVLDGTPLLDIKPYFESVDRPGAGLASG
ncbi:tRNA (N6-threonylcarbamoyladenosine(37)-N6)-methyltransferase TrmO [Fulvimarina endophytica]|uniref:tRNA (N6-threonylcarbamoyladenosine(37)-N6)-methyltransferase TrmO n=1 Tax=Fulvimarina endophytica TaxID=2293836 RepID=A0A371X7L8_9HYPH|nr:tRNA (N6-threonylcarbamoyladenosine(37)-N6)-methyltransferase TrmO [Fulvimarina endophytica]RFC65213.1 tRNA (N6-threonylcarbamoyladenosine(37)-N6)-methyltransferase TrmO [Fulvimarina endophytica]